MSAATPADRDVLSGGSGADGDNGDGGVARVWRSTLGRHLVVAVVGAALLFLLTETAGAYRNIQIAQIAYFACAAAGLTLLVGLSGQISLGHGGFMAVGAYTVALILLHWTSGSGSLRVLVALVASVLVTAVVGALVGAAAARLRGPYLAGATLAFAIAVPSLPSFNKFASTLGGSSGLLFTVPAPPGSIDPQRWNAWIACAAAVITLLLVANVMRSRVGRSMRGVRDDEIAASLSGLRVARVQILAFVISAGCAGLGGGLFALANATAAPLGFPLSLSLGLLAAVVLGGLGSLAGVAYGAIVIALLPQWSTDLATKFSLGSDVTNNLPLAVYGVVLIVAMLAFPYGVQGVIGRLVAAVRRR